MGDHKPIKIDEPKGSSKKGVLDFGPLERRLTSRRCHRMPLPLLEPQPVAAPEAQPLPVAAPEAQPLPVAAPEPQPLPPRKHALDREHAEREEQPAHKHAKRDEPLDRERAEREVQPTQKHRDEALDRERAEREVQPAQKHDQDEPLDRERAEREVHPAQKHDRDKALDRERAERVVQPSQKHDRDEPLDSERAEREEELCSSDMEISSGDEGDLPRVQHYRPSERQEPAEASPCQVSQSLSQSQRRPRARAAMFQQDMDSIDNDWLEDGDD